MMAAIHEHGVIWKDNQDGLWTALGEVLGKPCIFYAIPDTGEHTVCVDLQEAYWEISHDYGWVGTITLAGKRHYLAVVTNAPT